MSGYGLLFVIDKLLLPSFKFRSANMADHATTHSSELFRSCKVCAWCNSTGPRGGALKRCRGCNTTIYCGRECQAAAWPTHRQAPLRLHIRIYRFTASSDAIHTYTRQLCRSRSPQPSVSTAETAGYPTPIALGRAIREWAGLHQYTIAVYLHAMLRIAGGVAASVRENRVFLFFLISQRNHDAPPEDVNPATTFILKEARLVREDFSSTYRREERLVPNADFRPPGGREGSANATPVGSIPVLWMADGATFMVTTHYAVYPAAYHPDDTPPSDAMGAIFEDMSQIFMTFMNYGIVLRPFGDGLGFAPPESGKMVPGRRGWRWQRDRSAWRLVKELMPHHGISPQTPLSPTALWTRFWYW